MTAKTECYHIILEEMLGFGRGMGGMAVHASFFHRVMLEFGFGNGIANILMTLYAERIPFFEKDKFIIGGMGVVALHAVAFHNNFMSTFGILWYDPFMALRADFVGIFIQELSMDRGMRVMAF